MTSRNGPAAPTPGLTHVFSLRGELAPPVEQGEIDGGRRRFIPITGGKVYGPLLAGIVRPGGGDWQTVLPGGLTDVLARYFIEAEDGTVIGVTNTGVRTATPEVIDRLTRGLEVPPDQYYFRATPRFEVRPGPHDWLRRHVFVARGIRRPDHVIADFYRVD
ncbi:MAG TPA: DUF3237 domain-containing protein [Steroidobacteraceae bacterium]|nr:DUF3237 domain-containing protein [Steroidobacteraceae bacterium]